MRNKEAIPAVPFAKLDRGEMLIGRPDRFSDEGSFGRAFAFVPALVGFKGNMEEGLEIWIGENTSLARYKLADEIGNLVAVVCEGTRSTKKGDMRTYRVALLDTVGEVETLAGRKLTPEMRAAFEATPARTSPPAKAQIDPHAPIEGLTAEEADDLPF